MDIGQRVVDYVYERMQIDDPWAVRSKGRFAWWGGSLAQRVWANEPQVRDGVPVTTVHVETDLLRKVRPSADTLERLAGLNRLSTLSAYVADTRTHVIRLHASVSATEDNLALARVLALHATALQVADAHAEASPLAEIFGGEVDESEHPSSGPRLDEDEMLDVPSAYAHRGEGPSPFGVDELAELVRLEPRPWLNVSSEPTRVDAELAFDGDEPSRLMLDAAYRHPAIGSGIRINLTLPVPAVASRVQGLNAGEVNSPDAHQLGGWCASEDDRLMFVSFFPAVAHVPNLARAIVYHMATRNGWAHHLLTAS